MQRPAGRRRFRQVHGLEKLPGSGAAHAWNPAETVVKRLSLPRAVVNWLFLKLFIAAAGPALLLPGNRTDFVLFSRILHGQQKKIAGLRSARPVSLHA
jgi:hypothetical protein